MDLSVLGTVLNKLRVPNSKVFVGSSRTVWQKVYLIFYILFQGSGQPGVLHWQRSRPKKVLKREGADGSLSPVPKFLETLSSSPPKRPLPQLITRRIPNLTTSTQAISFSFGETSVATLQDPIVLFRDHTPDPPTSFLRNLDQHPVPCLHVLFSRHSSFKGPETNSLIVFLCY